jgi:hypothetical protein
LDGASVVDPLHLPFNGVPPRVQIEQIAADHKTYTANVAVKLPRLARDLEIDYTAEDRACQTILDTIRQVHSGRKSVPHEIAAGLAEHLSDDPLTNREVDVLRRVSEGNRNRI